MQEILFPDQFPTDRYSLREEKIIFKNFLDIEDTFDSKTDTKCANVPENFQLLFFFSDLLPKAEGLPYLPNFSYIIILDNNFSRWISNPDLR